MVRHTSFCGGSAITMFSFCSAVAWYPISNENVPPVNTSAALSPAALEPEPVCPPGQNQVPKALPDPYLGVAPFKGVASHFSSRRVIFLVLKLNCGLVLMSCVRCALVVLLITAQTSTFVVPAGKSWYRHPFPSTLLAKYKVLPSLYEIELEAGVMLLLLLSLMQTVALMSGGAAWVDANVSTSAKATNKPTNRIRLSGFIDGISPLGARLPLFAEEQPYRYPITPAMNRKAV